MTSEELNKYMHDFITEVCDEIGPRESGTEEEIQTGNKIETELKKYCDKTRKEKYLANPKAFLGGIRYGAALVLVSIVMYWLSMLIDLDIIPLEPFWGFIFMSIGIFLLIISVSYFILEVMRYHEAFDFLFPERESENIVGVIEPTGEMKQSLIFSAHHDSAYEFNLFYYLKRIGQILIFIGYGGVVLVFIVSIVKFILNLLAIYIDLVFLIFGIIFLVLLPIVGAYIFFHTYNSVLGAFDNLSGVAVVLGIGKYISDNKEELLPKHTKVYLISFAGEEAGLRGSKRYIERHFKELKEENTKVVNLDSIAEVNPIYFIDKETLIGATHEKEIYDTLYKIAREMEISAGIGPLPFGATDAAAFSKKTIPATSISGLTLDKSLPNFYHTRLDTPDVVDPKALGIVTQICVNYLQKVDKDV
jgi:hypothetical protein